MRQMRPNEGDTRNRSGFLVLPMTLTKHTERGQANYKERRWLERAVWQEVQYEGKWVRTRWIDD